MASTAFSVWPRSASIYRRLCADHGSTFALFDGGSLVILLIVMILGTEPELVCDSSPHSFSP
jgi:hypothetical protein